MHHGAAVRLCRWCDEQGLVWMCHSVAAASKRLEPKTGRSALLPCRLWQQARWDCAMATTGSSRVCVALLPCPSLCSVINAMLLLMLLPHHERPQPVALMLADVLRQLCMLAVVHGVGRGRR